jgi:hypothetical protein
MTELAGRLKREHVTLEHMVDIYCAGHHDPVFTKHCEPCADLLHYSAQRLKKCPYGQQKPTCAHCPIHCYKREPRAQVMAVMRYAGPRMPLRHPWIALTHLVDKLRRVQHPLALRRRKHSSHP